MRGDVPKLGELRNPARVMFFATLLLTWQRYVKRRLEKHPIIGCLHDFLEINDI